jgi:uncharacterized protein HemX
MFDEIIRLAEEIWVAAYHRAPRLTIVLTILGIVGIGTGVYYGYKVQQEKLEAKRLENQNYAKQLESLNQVRASL